jgi:tetratricopeptide (TPR) repeat protein
MRDHAGALRSVDAALNKWPDSAQLAGLKALSLQAQGRMDQAKDALTGVRPTSDDSSAIDAIYNQAVYTREYAPAIETMMTLLAREKELGSPFISIAGLHLNLGELRRLASDTAGAKADYERVLGEALPEAKRHPHNAALLSILALTYCGLGDRDAAMKYVDRLVILVPVTVDAFDGGQWEGTRARVWARFGDRDRAIPALARLLKLPAGFYTPAILRVDPDFDKLRGDRRFEALARGDEVTK